MDVIETTDIHENKKTCLKIKENLLGSLNVVQSEPNSTFVLWNKYQIFLYEDYNFESATKIFIPEFQIKSLYIANNYIVCLDGTGNIHVTTLKFKSAAQKRFKTSFQPKEQRVLSCVKLSNETILCLKMESGSYLFSVHQLNTEFQLERRILLTVNENLNPAATVVQENIILKCLTLSRNNYESIREKFDVSYNIGRDYSLVVVSFDKITVYGCLFSPKMPDEEIKLVKLYTNVSEICDISILADESIYVVISLTIGTVIKFSLEDTASTKPAIVHLNTALSRVFMTKTNNTIIYTDGISLWKTENSFSKNDIKFSEYFVKHVRDFIKVGNELICTTYSNLIYKFPVVNGNVFLKPTSEGEYCPAETLLNNSECYYKIIKEVEKGNELNKKISVEGSYLTALALSQRQDIMDEVIKANVIVYSKYQDAIEEHPETKLTEELNSYFEQSTVSFLVKLETTVIHHTFNDILSNLFGDLKIHVNIKSEGKLVKTTSVKLGEPLKKIELLLPVCTENNLSGAIFEVDTKVVTNIPGALDEKRDIWTVLYRKKFVFTSEYFVKTESHNLAVSLKTPDASIKELVLKVAEIHHGNLFHFINIFKPNPDMSEWNLYVKLPEYFKEKLSSEKYKEYFNNKTASFFLKQFSSPEFLTSKTNLCFDVGDERVKVVIVNYFSRPLLSVSSFNLKIAFHMRNFLSKIIYNDFEACKPGNEFVNYSLYATSDNLQRALKSSLTNQDEKEIFDLIEQFNRSVYGALPL